jgi:hypothetical protein
LRSWLAIPILAAIVLFREPGALAGSPGAPPAEIVLSEKDEAELAARGFVSMLVQTEAGGVTTAVVDSTASPSRAFAAVIDLPPRAAEVGSIEKVDVYLHKPPTATECEHIGARFELSVVGRTIVFHTLYDIDRERTWTTFTLDTSKENDIASASGSYHVYAKGSGSRIVYRTAADSDSAVPAWLKKWLTTSSLREQLEGIRARAETG